MWKIELIVTKLYATTTSLLSGSISFSTFRFFFFRIGIQLKIFKLYKRVIIIYMTKNNVEYDSVKHVLINLLRFFEKTI